MGAGVVERARLESVFGLKANAGSNPAPSARDYKRTSRILDAWWEDSRRTGIPKIDRSPTMEGSCFSAICARRHFLLPDPPRRKPLCSMKPLPSAFLAILSTAVVAAAQAEVPTPTEAPAPPTTIDVSALNRPGAIKLEAKETGSRKAIGHNWESSYGSYDRDFARGKTVTADLTNLSSGAPLKYLAIEVLWFSQRLRDKSIGLFHREVGKVTFNGRVAKYTADMPTLESSVLNYAALRERWVSGAKVYGWAVLLRSGETAVAVRASSPSLEALVKDGPKLTSTLEEFSKESADARRSRVR